jgi:hypothetical protein
MSVFSYQFAACNKRMTISKQHDIDGSKVYSGSQNDKLPAHVANC